MTDHDRIRRATVKHLLELQGYTQKRVADELGVTPPSVCQVIIGSSTSRRIQEHIAEICNRPPDLLFGRAA